jgi:hypothetical protein
MKIIQTLKAIFFGSKGNFGTIRKVKRSNRNIQYRLQRKFYRAFARKYNNNIPVNDHRIGGFNLDKEWRKFVQENT